MSLRNFCYTYNNYTDAGLAEVHAFEVAETVYNIYGKEVGKSGTPHLQGYCELRRKTRFARIQNLLPYGIHIENRRGTQAQAIMYCKKDGDFHEYGVPRVQGARSDLDGVRELADREGLGMVTRTANYQEILVAAKFLTYNERVRDWKPVVIWLYGPSGCGKSRLAREIYSEYCDTMKLYVKSEDSKWWDGYDSHGFVILDDYRDTWWKPNDLLRVLDRYECRVECKGGNRQLLAKVIVVTTINHPRTLYAHAKDEPIEQVIRRIDLILDLGKTDHFSPVPEVGGNTIPPT